MIYKTNRGLCEAVVIGKYSKDSFVKRINTLMKRGELSKEDVKIMLNDVYQRVGKPFNSQERNDAFDSLKNELNRN